MNTSSIALALPSTRMNATKPAVSGLAFESRFATPGVSPFDEVEWDIRTAEISDDTGKAMFRQ